MHTATDTIEPTPGETHRTACGQGRASYHPEWSPSQPWATYWNGTAGRHFATLALAAAYFRTVRGTRLEIKR